MDTPETLKAEVSVTQWTWVEIEERYLILVQYVVDISKRVRKLGSQLYSRRQKRIGIKGQLSGVLEAMSFVLVKDKRVMTILSPRARPEIQQWYEMEATSPEKEQPEYRLLVTSFRDEQLASHLKERFRIGPEEVKALQAIHDAKKQAILQLSPARVIGIALAASALVVKSLPKEFFEYLGWDYPHAVFLETIGALVVTAYVGIAFLPIWIRLYRDVRAYRQLGRILVYLSLMTSAPPQTAAAPRNA